MWLQRCTRSCTWNALSTTMLLRYWKTGVSTCRQQLAKPPPFLIDQWLSNEFDFSVDICVCSQWRQTHGLPLSLAWKQMSSMRWWKTSLTWSIHAMACHLDNFWTLGPGFPMYLLTDLSNFHGSLRTRLRVWSFQYLFCSVCGADGWWLWQISWGSQPDWGSSFKARRWCFRG